MVHTGRQRSRAGKTAIPGHDGSRHMNRRQMLKNLAAFCISAGVPLRAAAGLLEPGRFGRRDESPQATAPDSANNYCCDTSDGRRLTPIGMQLMGSVLHRFSAIIKRIGYGNFALISFDEARHTAAAYAGIGAFSKAETDFLAFLFSQDAADYGFRGHKPFKNITDAVDKSAVVKIPGTGNYLLNGDPLRIYRQMRADIGDKLVLTSGIRGVAKQFYLFLNKARKTGGNLSLAAHSIAPPGYSYHGIGDFDVGKTGLGLDNFTLRFTHTDVYKKLQQLEYAEFRYPPDNRVGVRFEPWHIKTL